MDGFSGHSASARRIYKGIMMTNSNRTRLIQVMLMTPVFFSSVSWAATELGEIVVTAERRTESIQNVPLSVAAIGGGDVNLGKIVLLAHA